MPASNGVVTLLRDGNRLRLNTKNPSIVETIQSMLTFQVRRILVGWEKKRTGKSVETEIVSAYAINANGYLCTSFGFYDKLQRQLKLLGYTPQIMQPEHPVLEPQWDRLFDPKRKIQLRHRQDEFLSTVAAHVENWLPGRFDCPPAFGKTTLIGFICLLYPKAKIHVISKRVAVLRDRIWPELAQLLPNVGIVGGGMNMPGRRVQLFTADSLGRSDFNADIMIADEIHELASDVAATNLARYDRSVNLGLSATHDMRIDGKDFRNEAIFGPIVFSMGYEEARQHNMVSPIRVYWREVNMPDPCQEYTDLMEKKRWGIWRNNHRNQMIAEDAMRYGDDEQVLITCEVIEHALFLKSLLPNFEVVYSENGVQPPDRRYFQKLGIWPEDELPMTLDRRDQLTQAFEKGRLKKAIVTTVWNVGVNFTQLGVLIRADAGGSPVMDTQIPGRTSRLHADKDYGIVHDYVDKFNSGFERKSNNRRRNYEANGWLQLELTTQGLTL